MSGYFLALLLAFAPLALAAPEKEPICRACHGINGADPLLDSYPRLAGQNQQYLEDMLFAYRAGQRKGGLSQLMVAQTKSLSDEEIKQLARYYSLIPHGSAELP